MHYSPAWLPHSKIKTLPTHHHVFLKDDFEAHDGEEMFVDTGECRAFWGGDACWQLGAKLNSVFQTQSQPLWRKGRDLNLDITPSGV